VIVPYAIAVTSHAIGYRARAEGALVTCCVPAPRAMRGWSYGQRHLKVLPAYAGICPKGSRRSRALIGDMVGCAAQAAPDPAAA